jgi:2-polyprenyl-3-methyl-5-hydroxy-6-metoxy-1,4-benzoquinol methylase
MGLSGGERIRAMSSDTAQMPDCRFCGESLCDRFVDLGMSPLCQRHVTPDKLNAMEPFYPLHTWVCRACLLVQLEQYVAPADIFDDYAYFSSFSDSWVDHARRYCEMAIDRFGLTGDSKVMEVASNDGYLLQHFVDRGVPCLGIEPAANVAKAAIDKGIPTAVHFLGQQTAEQITAEHGRADLVLGNNVLAHVPDLNDFVGGLRALLKPTGVLTMEFPHLHQLVANKQFDTIYHEHFSYFSLLTVEKVFAAHGLTLFDVQELPTHGGSLRVFARPTEADEPATGDAVDALRQREIDLGYRDMATYAAFAEQVRETKRKLLAFLIDAKRAGKQIVGYGAPGKGNTLLNYCGVGTDFLDYTVNRHPHKQGNYLPGTHIPIHPPDRIDQTRPDYILILPWNLKDEIARQMQHVRQWGGQFVVPIPEVEVI